MANKFLFASAPKRLPVADARNEAGGSAYRLTPELTLAQYAMTGCFSNTYYIDARQQLEGVFELCDSVDPLLLSQTAIHARSEGLMKDMPAFLLAVLSGKDSALFRKTFDRVADTPRMVRTFVQIMRSGAAGRTSLGTAPRNAIRAWLERRDASALLSASIGNSPSLKDIIRMVHPRPANPERERLYRYMIDKPVGHALLPTVIQEWETFKRERTGSPPDVPFQLLADQPLSPEQWGIIARRASWHTVRMNLNTFTRHDVWQLEGMTAAVAARLLDQDLIARARIFPYQVYVAWKETYGTVPAPLTEALETALTIAGAQCPRIEGRLCVCTDLSGSMADPVTGQADGNASRVTCAEVATLIAVTLLRQNPGSLYLPFDTAVLTNRHYDPCKSVLENVKTLSRPADGTACSAPIVYLKRHKERCSLVIVISDNESWADPASGHGTAMLEAWQNYKRFCPDARLVCINLRPYPTVQLPNREDIINIGGFSDSVFRMLSEIAGGRFTPDYWLERIRKVAV